MRAVKLSLCDLAGILTGLALGYVLWGQQAAALTTALAAVNRELATTKSWLLDEIEWSDERQERVSAALTKALTDLAHLRAQLARTAQPSNNQSNALPVHAAEPRTATVPSP
jgi:hypothetical protein